MRIDRELEEFRGAMAELNFWGDDADVLFKAYDVSGNGLLDFEEFAALL